jgi:ribosomal-protein-alanine N-acetyltransferase
MRDHLLICIVPFEDRHLTDEYVSWLNDSEVVRFSEQRHRHHTIETCRAWMQNYKKGPNKLWAIEYDKKHIGNICANVNEKNGVAEITNMIGNKNYWRKGIGTEAVRQAIERVFAMGYRKVYMGTLEHNIGQIRLMEKLGMKKEAVIPNQYLVDGEPCAVVYYGIYNS